MVVAVGGGGGGLWVEEGGGVCVSGHGVLGYGGSLRYGGKYW